MTAQQMATPAEQLPAATEPAPENNQPTPTGNVISVLEVSRAWQNTSYEKRLQLLRLAGFTVHDCAGLAPVEWNSLPVYAMQKIGATFRNLAAWVFENFKRGGVQ